MLNAIVKLVNFHDASLYILGKINIKNLINSENDNSDNIVPPPPGALSSKSMSFSHNQSDFK